MFFFLLLFCNPGFAFKRIVFEYCYYEVKAWYNRYGTGAFYWNSLSLKKQVFVLRYSFARFPIVCATSRQNFEPFWISLVSVEILASRHFCMWLERRRFYFSLNYRQFSGFYHSFWFISSYMWIYGVYSELWFWNLGQCQKRNVLLKTVTLEVAKKMGLPLFFIQHKSIWNNGKTKFRKKSHTYLTLVLETF